MKKTTLGYLLLVLFLFPGFSAIAGTNNITQNAIFTAPNDCPNPVVRPVNSQNTSFTGGNFTLNMSHDITNSQYAYFVHDRGLRYVYWDIYDVDAQGNQTYETTISEHALILDGGVTTGNSSTSFNFNMGDVVVAGLSSGSKVVRLRIKMILNAMPNSNDIVNGEIQANGVEICDANPLDGSMVECDLGIIDCFRYIACDADYTVDIQSTLVAVNSPQGDVFFVQEYHYNANILGGSGNFSFSWTGPGLPHSSTSSSYVFQNPDRVPGLVRLEITDNVTGCVYRWAQMHNPGFFKSSIPSIQSSGFQIGPNPMHQGQELISHFNLNQGDVYAMKVFDVHGRLFFDTQDIRVTVSGEQVLDLTGNFAPGIYFVQFNSQEFGSQTKRLIVQ